MGYKHRAPYSWCGLLWQCKSHVRQKSASCKWNAKKLSFSYLVIHRKSTFGFPPIKDGLNRNISIRTWEGVSETCRGCSEQKHTIFQPNVLQKRESSAPLLPQIIRNLCRQAALLNTPLPPPPFPMKGSLVVHIIIQSVEAPRCIFPFFARSHSVPVFECVFWGSYVVIFWRDFSLRR